MKLRSIRNHWVSKHGTMVPKIQFKTLDEVLDYMDKHSINKDTFNPYVCSECGMWHIGHRRKRR